jgi:hypothetical protein
MFKITNLAQCHHGICIKLYSPHCCCKNPKALLNSTQILTRHPLFFHATFEDFHQCFFGKRLPFGDPKNSILKFMKRVLWKKCAKIEEILISPYLNNIQKIAKI